MTERPNVEESQAGSEMVSGNNASGKVKWFNNKAGYGFITVTSGEHADSDVFVHHSAIKVDQEQYRYLIQGEYVDFEMCSVSDAQHNWQAGKVRGIHNGKLMCETRLESRQNRQTTKESEVPKRGVGVSRHHHHSSRDDQEGTPVHRVKSRGPGPREGDEWMLVRRRIPRANSHQENLRSRLPRGVGSNMGKVSSREHKEEQEYE